MAKYTFIIVSLFCQCILAQDSLCVFKANGSVLKVNSGKIQSVKKGDYLINADRLVVDNSADVLAIDKQGHAYVLNAKGDYSFKNLLSKKQTKTSSGLTSKYFKLIWNELRDTKASATLIGGVFRGEQLMQFPLDSSKIAGSKVKFSWKETNENTDYYLFVRNIETDALAKYQTHTNALYLYKSNPIFDNSTSFEWCVTTEEFPNLKNLTFYTFELLSKSEYKSLKKDYVTLENQLKALGLSDEDINKSICKIYRICN